MTMYCYKGIMDASSTPKYILTTFASLSMNTSHYCGHWLRTATLHYRHVLQLI